MKKVILLFLVMLLLCGCTQKTKEVENMIQTTAIPEESEVTVTTETKEQASTRETVKDYRIDILPTRDAIIEYATLIFRYARKPEGAENYKITEVLWHDDGKTITVFFSEGNIYQIYNAEVDHCQIDFSAKTGKVVRLSFITAEERAEINKKNGWERVEDPFETGDGDVASGD